MLLMSCTFYVSWSLIYKSNNTQICRKNSLNVFVVIQGHDIRESRSNNGYLFDVLLFLLLIKKTESWFFVQIRLVVYSICGGPIKVWKLSIARQQETSSSLYCCNVKLTILQLCAPTRHGQSILQDIARKLQSFDWHQLTFQTSE